MSFPNLAGNVDCDIDIVTELQEAGIGIVPRSKGPLLHSEVPFHVFGRLGEVTFVRAWRYWGCFRCRDAVRGSRGALRGSCGA